MATRRAGRKQAKDQPQQTQELSKADEAIAKYVRFNCPTKTSMIDNNEVQYFSGKAAVDTIFDSKKYGQNAKDTRFARRQLAADFMTSLMQRGMFFRARVLVPKKKPEQKTDKKAEEKPKKKKIKLIAHDVQTFNDDTDVYVWIYDPTPFMKKLIGFGIVLGTIGACLFPLWPDWLRLIIYYASLVGIGLFGLLLGVAMLRTVFFGIIYAVTFGKHKLWLLPNLTEDCGFFESFQPFYTYEYCSGEGGGGDGKTNTASSAAKADGEDEEEEEEEAEKEEAEEEDEEEEEKEEEKASGSGASSTDSSEPVDVAKEDAAPRDAEDAPEAARDDDAQNASDGPRDAEDEPKSVADLAAAKAVRQRRRRVRRVDDDNDFVMVQDASGGGL